MCVCVRVSLVCSGSMWMREKLCVCLRVFPMHTDTDTDTHMHMHTCSTPSTVRSKRQYRMVQFLPAAHTHTPTHRHSISHSQLRYTDNIGIPPQKKKHTHTHQQQPFSKYSREMLGVSSLAAFVGLKIKSYAHLLQLALMRHLLSSRVCVRA